MGEANNIPGNRLIRQIQTYARVQWIFAGALMATAMLFYFGVYRPQAQQLESMNREIAAKKMELDADRSQTSRLPRVRSELDALRQSLAGYKKLPAKSQYGEFISQIDKASQASHLTKLFEEPGSQTNQSPLYLEKPVVLSFEASFPDLFSFLTQIENMDRLTRLRNVEIKTIDAVHGIVSVKLSVNIYYTEG
jgi:Tfp pilus assembly protein PilO